jgi:hypothetical protein
MRLIVRSTFEGLAMSAADDALLRRLEELDHKVRLLESRRRRVPGWCAVLACGLLGGWLGRFVTEPPSARAQGNAAIDVVAKSIKVLNDQGKPAVELGQDRFGGFVRILHPDGKSIVAVEGDGDGGCVRIAGPEGLERAFLGVGENKGGGLLYFRNAEGKMTPVSLGVGPKGGYLSLKNVAANEFAVWLGSDSESNGVVHVHDHKGSHRCELGINKQGGELSLFGSKRNQAHVYLGTGTFDIGGLLLLRDDDGKVRAEMGQGKNGGYLLLNGNKDDRANINTSEDQRGGFMQLRGGGKLFVELGIDNAGVGYVDTQVGK